MGVPQWDWSVDGVTELRSPGEGRAWPSSEELSSWTDQLLDGGIGQLSFERIGPIGPDRKRVANRIENFCGRKGDVSETGGPADHKEWRDFATGPLCEAVSAACGVPMVLYKEKLNLKPAGGGGGFAPHLDTPSLRAMGGLGGEVWPRTFVTAMVSIDAMTDANGCLRVARPPQGLPPWSEEFPPAHDKGVESDNPDAGGRAGGLEPCAMTDSLVWESIECAAGCVYLFNGWVPHRSAANLSNVGRRAVFFTYNPAEEGEVREAYYASMAQRRKEYMEKMQREMEESYKREAAAFATIPTSSVRSKGEIDPMPHTN